MVVNPNTRKTFAHTTDTETVILLRGVKKQRYVAEHNDGLKVSSLYIAQVKKKCGIETGENHNLHKSEGAKVPVDLCSARTEVETKTARQPQVTLEKEEAIMKAFRHFGVLA